MAKVVLARAVCVGVVALCLIMLRFVDGVALVGCGLLYSCGLACVVYFAWVGFLLARLVHGLLAVCLRVLRH